MKEYWKYDSLQLIYMRMKKDYDNSVKSAVLNGKYSVEEDEDTHTIKISKEDEYIDGLWGDKICDCYAIVGENGSGKTQIMNMIMDFFYWQKNTGITNSPSFLVIMENIETHELLQYTLGGNLDINVENNTGQHMKVLNREELKHLNDKYKVAYFHNELTRNDYEIRQLCDYDFSVGGLISKYFKTSVEMKYYDSRKLPVYFK